VYGLMRRGTRLKRRLMLVLLPVLLAAAAGAGARPAAAQHEYVHGNAIDCGTCHLDNHTRWAPLSAACNNCHPSYELPDLSMTCWTCHVPGQDMRAQRTDSACTAGCHLPDGSTVTHAPHPARSTACTGCHGLSASVTDAADSVHHTAPTPSAPSSTPTPAPVIAEFKPAAGAIGCPVTVTGDWFADLTGVAFNGQAADFTPISARCVLAFVPAGATSGVISITTPAGSGASASAFTVAVTPPRTVTADLSLRLRSTRVRRGRLVRASGQVKPPDLAGLRVKIRVQRHANGRWIVAKRSSAVTTAAGAYRWTLRRSRRGVYRIRAIVSPELTHTGDVTPWVRFRVI
jgi:hypothetical protein